MNHEPLKDKTVDFASTDEILWGKHYYGFPEEDVKSAAKLFQKYSEYAINTYKLKHENEKLYDKCMAYIDEHDWTNGSDKKYEIYFYFKWLFEYCFEDVIK